MTGLPEHSPAFPPIRDFMAKYGAAFDSYDLDTIVKHYHTPCFIYKGGNALFLSDDGRKLAYFEDLLGRLRAAGVHHTDLPEITVTPLGLRSAVVTVRWVSKTEDGSVVWDFLDSYILAHFADQWRFIGDIVHEGDYSKATSIWGAA